MSKLSLARIQNALLILGIASCGIFMKADKGLFGDEFMTASVSRGNDLRGVWELNSNSNIPPTTGGTQATNFNFQTRMRIQFDSATDTSLRVTTLCESPNPNDYNKTNATYVNTEAWVTYQNQGSMGGTQGFVSGQIYISQFRNSATSGEKNANCVTPLQVGNYSFQVQNGQMYMNAQTGSPTNSTFNGSYSFQKVRD